MEKYTCSCCNPAREYQSHKTLSKHRRAHDNSYDLTIEHLKAHRRLEYYKNPLKCAECEIIIAYERVSLGYSKKFCSRRCSAVHSNRVRNKKRSVQHGNCLFCNKLRTRNTSKYCSSKCMQDHRWDMLKTNPETIWTSNNRKRFLLELTGHKCSKCNLAVWNDLPISLELEHISGNSEDNSEENVCLLCPNCHAQTPTYKGKNKGNGRHLRRQRYADGKSY